LREALALAFQLDDESTVRKLLNDWPELKTTFLSVLPLAPYLLTHCIEAAGDRKSIIDYAELYAKLQQDTAALMDIIREKRRSLAIVGNSPCEIGLGQGARIDAHDLVARFNVFSTREFAIDYGRRCNIHVRSLPEDENANELSAESDTIVLSRADLIYRNRDWKNVLQLAHSGAKLAAFPTGFHQSLYKILGGAPSSGIAFCALVKQERGILLRSSCFGFAFVDQIAPKPSSAHYFRDARPSFKHQWKRERELFDKITAISPDRP
jgi:Glycosyltransferase family 29 (sialyltransferase)